MDQDRDVSTHADQLEERVRRLAEAEQAPEALTEGQGVVLSVVDVTERERLMKELADERSRLQTIIETAPEAIVVADEWCRIVLANPAAERLYARPVPYGEDIESHAQFGLYHPDGTPYDPRDLPLTRSALDGETIDTEEMVIRWPDGQRRDLLVSSAPIRDEQGRVTGAVGVFQDITERKRTREALRRYAERLHILHQTDRAILAAQSLDEIAEATLGHIRQMIPCQWACVALFDAEADELSLLAACADGPTRLEKGWRGPLEWACFVEGLGENRMHVVEDVQRISTPSPLIETLKAEGVRAYVSVPLVAQGELIGSLNLGMDAPGPLTPEQMDVAREVADQLAIGIQQIRLYKHVQRHAEELEYQVARRTAKLRASEARFRAIFEAAALGIILTNRRGRILDSNPALQQMLGYSGHELRGRPFTAFARHPDDAGADADLFAELVAGERDSYEMEIRYLRHDGQPLWVSVIPSLVRGAAGRPAYVIAMVEDITRRKQAQTALIQAEKLALTGRLAASLAHEINNPLQSVIGCLGLAEESLAAGEDAGRLLQIATEELERAAGIVTRLRDLNRPSRPEDREPIGANTLVERVLALTREKCQSRQVEVIWKGAADLPSLMVVADRIQQVFLNLVLNALEAMPDGGRLEVSTAKTSQPAGVDVSFSDSGPGIPPHVLARLFDPFVTTKPDGLGLGLYITHAILEEHGGRIEVDSQPGQGTTFVVWLPAA